MICPHYRAGTSSDLICRVCLKGCHGGLVLSMEVLSTCIWVVAGAITVGGALSACSAAVLQSQCWPTPTYCSPTTKIWTQMSLKIIFNKEHNTTTQWHTVQNTYDPRPSKGMTSQLHWLQRDTWLSIMHWAGQSEPVWRVSVQCAVQARQRR